MRNRLPLILSVIGVCFPIITVPILLFIEPEFTESVSSGLLLGWICGAVLGVVALTLNRKQKQVIVKILSVVSIVPMLICLILFIPYFLFKSA